jgi:hypothetical protein
MRGFDSALPGLIPWSDTLAERLADKVGRFSVGDDPLSLHRPTVVCSPHLAPDSALELASKQVVRGGRILGHGLTLRPVRAPLPPGVCLTELGAFAVADRGVDAIELHEEISALTKELFGSNPTARAMRSAVAWKLFLPLFEVWPILPALVHAVGLERIVVVERVPYLKPLLECFGRETGSQRVRRLAVAMLAPLAGARALGREARGRRRFLRDWKHQLSEDSVARSTWLALTPDWPRMNRPLVRGVGNAAAQTNDLGVVLVGNLPVRQRNEAGAGNGGGGLDELPSGPVPLIQAITPRDGLRFLAASAAGFLRGNRGAWRLFRSARPLTAVCTSASVRQVLGLFSTDSLRCELGQEAARSLALSGAKEPPQVFFAAANNPGAAGADVVLQARGAVTFDYLHGAPSDVYAAGGYGESSVFLAWVSSDAERARRLGMKVELAGLPQRPPSHDRAPAPTRVLIATNYLHADQRTLDGWPFMAFLEELLETVTSARVEWPSLEWRWRPHPRDNPDAVRTMATRYRLEVSTNSLELDLAWAQLWVSSFSTVVLDALAMGLPVLHHRLPEHVGLPVGDHLVEERSFFSRQEGMSRLREFLANPLDLAPESEALKRLFGGPPRDLGSHVRARQGTGGQGG